MNPASPASLKLASVLLALEATRAKNSGGRESATSATKRADHAVRVCEKLRSVLTTFAGSAGFRSLLTRALTLAKAQEHSLAAVHVLEDGSLRGLAQVGGKSSAGARETAAVGGQVLVAYLLDLLIILIGEPLMHQLVRSAWPNAPTSVLRSKTKDTP